MKETLQNNLIYVKVEAVAEAKGVGLRAIQKACAKDKYVFRYVTRLGCGGKQYEILLSSLEPEVQEKVLNNIKTSEICGCVVDHGGNYESNCNGQAPVFFNQDNFHVNHIRNTTFVGGATVIGGAHLSLAGSNVENTFILNSNYVASAVVESRARFSLKENVAIPEKAKKLALAKVDLLNYWESFRNRKNDKVQADKDFAMLYNSKKISENIFNIVGKVSVASLYRWKKAYKDNHNNYYALIPAYSYGKESELTAKLEPVEQEYFLKLMLDQNQIKCGKAYEHVSFFLREHHPQIKQKSIATYKRFWDYYKRNHFTEITYAREGLKAVTDKATPHLIRDSRRLNVGDVLVADGHKLDFNLKHPITGKPFRAMLILFQDWASRDVVGWDIVPTENTQGVSTALRNAIIRLGKIPKVVRLDNGKAFKNKHFTGTNIYKECGIVGLYETLGIQVSFSKAYSGRSKIVERFFKEFTESCAVLSKDYVGNSIAKKPAYLMRNEKFHQVMQGDGKNLCSIEDFKAIFEGWWLSEIYRRRPCRNDKQYSIGEFFEKGKGVGIDVDMLDDLMMAEETRKVGRNGIKMFDRYYYSNELIGLNDRVSVKYSWSDINKVKVYSLKGEYICTAESIIAVHPEARLLGTTEDYTTYKMQLKHNQQLINSRLKQTRKYLKNVSSLNPMLINCKNIEPKEVKTIEREQTELLEAPLVIDCYRNLVPMPKPKEEEVLKLDLNTLLKIEQAQRAI